MGISGQELGMVHCYPAETVGSLKAKIAVKFGRSGPWKVLLGDQVLKHEESLRASGVTEGATVNLVQVLEFLFSTGPQTSCSPSQTVSNDGLTVKSNSVWGCTLLQPPLSKDVAFSRVTFRVHRSPGWGSNGVYFGITPADHDIAGGFAACGASTTFVYRCRDGDKRIGGRWQKFNTRRPRHSQGSYKEG